MIVDIQHIIWMCDSCNKGKEACKKTITWVEGCPCPYCKVGQMAVEKTIYILGN